MKILLATRNAKKLVELQRIVDAAGLAATIVGMADVDDYVEVPETGLTFAENALLKATEGVKYTGLPSIADDSGLAVDVLGGMPGIFSARWSGRHGDDDANLDLVLAQIGDMPDTARTASFMCAAALALPDGRTFVTEGRMPGRLIRERRGSGGFGYDPIFVADAQSPAARSPAARSPAARSPAARSPAAKNPIAQSPAAQSPGGQTSAAQPRTNAELEPAEKDAISHRGQAFRALAEVIARELP